MNTGRLLLLALAVSLNLAAPIRAQERPGWVGVSLDVVTTSQGGTSRTFVRIADVQAGSPAARAGLSPGDLLLQVNDLVGPEDLAQLPTLLRLHVGDSVRMLVRRGSQTREAHLAAGERPAVVMAPRPSPGMVPDPDSLLASITQAMDSLRIRLTESGSPLKVWTGAPNPSSPSGGSRAGPPPEPAVWRLDASGSFSPLAPYVLGRNRVAGAEVIDLRPELASYFGVREGVLVVDVPAGTPAAAADFRPGDVIVALAGNDVGSVRDLRVGVARPGNALPVWVVRQGERVRLLLGR